MSERSVLTPLDRERLAPVVRGEYPTESAMTVVEQIVREHIAQLTGKELG